MTDEDLTPWEMKFNKALQDFNVKKITEAEFLAIGEEVLKVTDCMPIVQTARAEMPYDTYAALRRCPPFISSRSALACLALRS